MRFTWWRRRQPDTRVSRDPSTLALIRIEVAAVPGPDFDSYEADAELDTILWDQAQSAEEEIRAEVASAASAYFGSGVKVEVTLTRGSVLITAIVLGFVALAQYRQAVENLDWLRRHLEHVIRTILGGTLPRRGTPGAWIGVSASVMPGAGLWSAEPSAPAADLTLAYLIVSHAALLAVVLWLVVAKV